MSPLPLTPSDLRADRAFRSAFGWLLLLGLLAGTGHSLAEDLVAGNSTGHHPAPIHTSHGEGCDLCSTPGIQAPQSGDRSLFPFLPHRGLSIPGFVEALPSHPSDSGPSARAPPALTG
ncbi:MAG: hypothetical protein EA421_04630 [Gemmatimonadales bacterium]|nr:MAG: hypothetical protein EA421_04630 [Gemmatimonadales bacterium]